MPNPKFKLNEKVTLLASAGSHYAGKAAQVVRLPKKDDPYYMVVLDNGEPVHVEEFDIGPAGIDEPEAELVCNQLPAEERAAIVGREIKQAIRDGRFAFVQGYLKRIQTPGERKCKYGGCAIAALAFAVVGSKPDPHSPYYQGDSCRRDAVETGLITYSEAYELENAYEGDPPTEMGPFGRLGEELRKLAEKRGGRYDVINGDRKYNAKNECFYEVGR